MASRIGRLMAQQARDAIEGEMLTDTDRMAKEAWDRAPEELKRKIWDHMVRIVELAYEEVLRDLGREDHGDRTAS